jgi:hypothetical protein
MGSNRGLGTEKPAVSRLNSVRVCSPRVGHLRFIVIPSFCTDSYHLITNFSCCRGGLVEKDWFGLEIEKRAGPR